MNSEKRSIKASIMAGVCDILVGLIMYLTGWHVWYYEHFHFFGILGMGMLIYGFWHNHYYKLETGRVIWDK